MPVREAVDVTNLESSTAHNRLVTPEDAEMMKARSGFWFEVESNHKSPAAARTHASVLRRKLSWWYGGQWRSATRGTKMFFMYTKV